MVTLVLKAALAVVMGTILGWVLVYVFLGSVESICI